ncbi:chloride channel protein [Candidatus Riflebacteria bacterium]
MKSRILQQKDTRALIYLFVSCLIGAFAGLGVLFFLFLLDFIQYLFLFQVAERSMILKAVEQMTFFHIILVPTLGGLLVGTAHYFLKLDTQGSGVPEIIKALILKQGTIEKRSIALKAVSTAVTLGSGGSCGYEGPMAFVGGGIGSEIGRFFHLKEAGVKTMLAAGSAAGVAATFNCPLGGAFFAAEVILGEISLNTFSPVVVASVIATAITRGVRGNNPDFQVPGSFSHSQWDLFYYLGLGIFCALFAIFFVRIFLGIIGIFRRLDASPPIKGALGGFCIGLLIYIFPELYGSGYALTSQNMQDIITRGFPYLTALLFIKVLATSITLASGGNGGIFGPALFLGSTLGIIYGHALKYFIQIPDLNPGAYSLVGVASLLSAMTHSPISATVMAFELTGDYELILPIMLACSFSSILARYFMHDSFYTVDLREFGMLRNPLEHLHILQTIPVSRRYHKNITRFNIEDSLRAMFKKSLQCHWYTFPVVDDNNAFLGFVDLDRLREVFGSSEREKKNTKAADLLTGDIFVYEKESMETAEKIFMDYPHLHEIPVLNEEKEVIGLFSQTDLLHALHREVDKRRIAYSILERMSLEQREKLSSLQISKDLFLEEVAIRDEMVGQTISKINFRHKYNMEIIMVRSFLEGKVEEQAVTPIYKVRIGDTFLVIGTKDTIRYYQRGYERKEDDSC